MLLENTFNITRVFEKNIQVLDKFYKIFFKSSKITNNIS